MAKTFEIGDNVAYLLMFVCFIGLMVYAGVQEDKEKSKTRPRETTTITIRNGHADTVKTLSK